MKAFIVYNVVTGKILRTGTCPDVDFELQAQAPNERIFEGKANDITQKIINEKVVDKTFEEIEVEKPPEVPVEQQEANITNDQWQDIINRLELLESK